MNVYKDYLGFEFDKIFWSRLVPIHIASDGLYRCDCCNKFPHECINKKSAAEYDKIRRIVDIEREGFGVSSYLYPIRHTGYLRADMFYDADLIWKIQRELARVAGFELKRSSFF
ncbi:MAG: hypothetical protein NC350_03950 [Corallococcus sp.]|nr:hypothetical protein [Corallococcus sp.]